MRHFHVKPNTKWKRTINIDKVSLNSDIA